MNANAFALACITALLAACVSATAADDIAPISGTPWKSHEIDTRCGGPDGVRIYDVNGDGYYDIVSGWEHSSKPRVYINPGPDKVGTAWLCIDAGHSKDAEDAVFADLDNDGVVDVITSCEAKTQTLFIHWAPSDPGKYTDAAAWQTEALPSSVGKSGWMFSVPIQLDGKNGLDIVAGGKGVDDQNRGLWWFEAPVNPRNLNEWKAHSINREGSFFMEITPVDIDYDGDMDIMCSERSSQRVAWYENPGTGTEAQKGTWQSTVLGKRGSTFFGKVGDVDGDGLEDYCLSTGGDIGHVLFFKSLDKSGKNWKETMINGPASGQKAAAIGDIDGDGKNDILQTMSGGGGVACAWASYEGDPTNAANWKWHHISGNLNHRIKTDRMEVVDIDGDGDLDVTTTQEACDGDTARFTGVVWWENPIGKPPKTNDHAKYQPPLKGGSPVAVMAPILPLRRAVAHNLEKKRFSPLGRRIASDFPAASVLLAPGASELFTRGRR